MTAKTLDFTSIEINAEIHKLGRERLSKATSNVPQLRRLAVDRTGACFQTLVRGLVCARVDTPGCLQSLLWISRGTKFSFEARVLLEMRLLTVPRDR